LLFDVQAGNRYWLQVGGRNGATGRLQLTVNCDPTCPPYNDTPGYNVSIFEPPFADSVNTEGATLDPGEPQPCGSIGKTVWYGVTVRGDTTIRINADGSSFDAVIAAYEQTGVSPPPGSLDLIQCEDAADGEQPTLTLDARANVVYWIQAGGRNGADGTLNLNADCDPSPCPPPNDSHLSVNDGFDAPFGLPWEAEANTTNATVEDDEPLDCGDMAKTVWYRVYSWPKAWPVSVSTQDSEYDTSIAVYRVDGPEGSWDSYERVGCAPGGSNERAQLDFTSDPSSVMLVQVGSRNDRGGALHVRANCVEVCPPYNDDVGQALDVFPINFLSEQRDTRGATLEASEPTPCGLDGNFTHTVWYRFHSEWDATITVSAEGSDYHTAIGVYRVDWSAASPPGGLTPMACNRIDEPSKFNFEIAPATDYYVQVGSVGNSAGGMLALEIKCVADCPAEYGPGTPGFVGGTGAVQGPDTGSGGYLPGARNR
jgi:hypothetical protein